MMFISDSEFNKFSKPILPLQRQLYDQNHLCLNKVYFLFFVLSPPFCLTSPRSDPIGNIFISATQFQSFTLFLNQNRTAQ